jgi:hypothetical protein
LKKTSTKAFKLEAVCRFPKKIAAKNAKNREEKMLFEQINPAAPSFVNLSDKNFLLP